MGLGMDLCVDVVPVPVAIGDNITLTGDNSSATSMGDFDPASPFFDFQPIVTWHAFTTTECMDVTFNYCGTDPVWAETWGFLFTDCPAVDPIQPTGFDPALCEDGNNTYQHFSLPAGTYYLAVPQLGSSMGAYSITLFAAACPTGSANDMCGDVVPSPLNIGASLEFTGDNTTATSAGDFDPTTPFGQFGVEVVWHGFTTTSCSNIVMDYCGTDPAWSNSLGMLLNTCPANEGDGATLTAFNNTDCGDGNTTYYFDAVPPGTYYIPVLKDMPNNSFGPYVIHVTANSCGGSVNDYCQDVVPVVMELGTSMEFTGNNAGATALNDFSGPPFEGTPVAWHAITLLSCTDLTVDYCGTQPAWINTLGIISSTCPADSLIEFSTADTQICGNENISYMYEDLAAGIYYIPVVNDPFNNPGSDYAVTVTAELCSPAGLQEDQDNTFQVFPNPTSGKFNVTNNGNAEIVSFDVMDAQGRTVKAGRVILAPGASMQIELNSTSNGVYVLRIVDRDGKRSEQRLIIQ